MPGLLGSPATSGHASDPGVAGIHRRHIVRRTRLAERRLVAEEIADALTPEPELLPLAEALDIPLGFEWDITPEGTFRVEIGDGVVEAWFDPTPPEPDCYCRRCFLHNDPGGCIYLDD